MKNVEPRFYGMFLSMDEWQKQSLGVYTKGALKNFAKLTRKQLS